MNLNEAKRKIIDALKENLNKLELLGHLTHEQ